MAIFPGSAIPSAVSDYEIDNSVRFEDADSAELSRTFGSAGDQTAWTFSAWIKRVDRAEDIGARPVFGAYTDSSNWSEIRYHSDHDSLRWIETISGSTVGQLRTSASYRDPSSWYHITCTWDSDNGTSGNRMRMYVNGEEVTAFATDTNPSSGQVSATNKACEHTVGSTRDSSSTYYTSGYMAEVYFIDGTALTPSTFGELDSDTNQWKPLDSGGVKDAVTFGTNGFFQKYNSTELATSFEDSSPLTTDTTFSPTESITANILLVAGGGAGGGNHHGAGGGGGGVLYKTGQAISAGDYSVVVGAGGIGVDAARGGSGENTTFLDLTAFGGGGGGNNANLAGGAGGSGGGGGATTGAGGATTQTSNGGGTGYGYAGGTQNGVDYGSTGGGGAGGVGGGNSSGTGGPGGVGVSNSITGAAVTYAGGGGGSSYSTGGAGGAGGTGGGGNGETYNTGNYQAGTDGLGGGGGGNGGYTAGSGELPGPKGGSGTAIISYISTTAKATGGTITSYTSGSDTYQVHTFSQAGHTITANGDVKNVRGANLDTTYANPVSFTSSTTWTAPAGVTSVEYLVVAGGGQGGYDAGGGGGAGGYRTGTLSVTPGSSYTVTVGAGGTSTQSGSSKFGADGENSVFGSITATGGGGGGSTSTSISGRTGGSGGGGGGYNASGGSGGAGNAGSFSPVEGYVGGAGASGATAAGGGGGGSSGAGAAGGSPTNAGGAGTSNSITGSAVTYAAGGTGNSDSSGSNTSGAANTGNGGNGGAGSPQGGAGGSGIVVISYDVAKPGSSSIEFDGTGDYLSTASSSDFGVGTGAFTMEAWVRWTSVSSGQMIFGSTSGNKMDLLWNGTYYRSYINESPVDFTSSAPTANTWYHYAISRSGTDVRLFIDGAQVHTTQTSSGDVPDHGMCIGAQEGNAAYFNGYMDEIRISDSARYTSAFTPQRTQFTTDANTMLLIHSDWTGGLGADSSGNFNNFTATNLVATDQMIDTPTNNWCTFNPLIQATQEPTLSEGNLQCVSASGTYGYFAGATFGVSSGKWYAEYYHKAGGGGCSIGIIPYDQDFGTGGNYVGSTANTGTGYYGGGSIFNYDNAGSADAGPDSFDTGDIIGVALDLDDSTGKVYFYKNGTLQDTGLTNDAGNNYNLKTVSTYWTFGCGLGADWTNVANFGADSSFAGSVTAQGNQDGNEKGDFYYTPPSGFLALCTDNLSTPEIKLPGENFNTVLYTGNDATSRAITGSGLKPDLVWIKSRSAGDSHALFDAVRGTPVIHSNANNMENSTTGALMFKSYDTDGFTVGYDASADLTNRNSQTYVGWNWKGNGVAGGTLNEVGSIDSQVNVNTTAGLSITTYTGNATTGATVGHGLGVVPDTIWVKQLTGATGNWRCYFKPLGANTSIYLSLDEGNAGAGNGHWNNTSPTSTVFTIKADDDINNSGRNYLAYCFASIEGYSKVGSYTGNANANGTFIYTGFRPAFLIAKNSGANGKPWVMYDDKRDTYNEMYKQLLANDSAAANTSEGRLDFVSNGIKWRIGDSYHNDGDFIYIAFAESPFKYSNAR